MTNDPARTTPIQLFLCSYAGYLFAPCPSLPCVIVFFVISGFCIHYPYHKGKPVLLREFLVRRCLRIGIPLSICLLIAYFVYG
jgi:peptidoglycan/LPS O-acetylase OafA/YrhL